MCTHTHLYRAEKAVRSHVRLNYQNTEPACSRLLSERQYLCTACVSFTSFRSAIAERAVCNEIKRRSPRQRWRECVCMCQWRLLFILGAPGEFHSCGLESNPSLEWAGRAQPYSVMHRHTFYLKAAADQYRVTFFGVGRTAERKSTRTIGLHYPSGNGWAFARRHARIPRQHNQQLIRLLQTHAD